jgi:hypothetical protein
MEKKMRRIIVFLSTFLITSAAFATTLSYEGFDYSSGNLSGNGGGFGWFTDANWTISTAASASNFQISSGSLDAGDLLTTGNHIVSSGNNTHIYSRRMEAAAPSSGEFWASIVVQTNGLGGGLTFSNNANDNLNLNATDFNNRARFGFGINAGNFVYTLDGLEGTPVSGSVAGATGDATLLVAKFDVTNGLFSMWANPTLGGASPSGGTSIAEDVSFNRSGSTFANDVTHVGLFANWNGIQLDEVRLGTDFASVAIPEPSTLALLGIAGLCAGLFARRRR